MPIAFDAVSSATKAAGNATTVSWNHTVATSANSILIVASGVVSRNSSLVNTTAISYAGSAFTKAVTARNQTATSVVYAAELWYLLNPTAGTTLINVTFGNSSFSIVQGLLAASFTGTTGIGVTAGSTGNSSAPSQAITLSTGGSWSICAVKSNAAVLLTTVSGETIRVGSTIGTDYSGLGDAAPGSSGANTFNFTGGVAQPFAIVALDLIPTTVVAGGDARRLRALCGVGI